MLPGALSRKMTSPSRFYKAKTRTVNEQSATSEGVSFLLRKRPRPSPSTSDAGLDHLFHRGNQGVPNQFSLIPSRLAKLSSHNGNHRIKFHSDTFSVVIWSKKQESINGGMQTKGQESATPSAGCKHTE